MNAENVPTATCLHPLDIDGREKLRYDTADILMGRRLQLGDATQAARIAAEEGLDGPCRAAGLEAAHRACRAIFEREGAAFADAEGWQDRLRAQIREFLRAHLFSRPG